MPGTPRSTLGAIEPTSTPVLHRRDAPSRRVGDQLVIGRTDHAVVVGGAAVTVWEALDRPGDRGELLQRIAALRPDVPIDELEVTIDEAIAVLSEEDLIDTVVS